MNKNEQTQFLKANLGYGVEYYQGRGISSITVNADNTLTIHYSDNTTEITNPMFINGNIGWPQLAGKPFSTIGDNLVVENGVLRVDTTTEVEEDNTKPITSGGVSVVVGNIDALLAVI